MRLVIIDSGGANIASLRFAFERLNCTPMLSADPQTVRNATHVVLPGVGAAADAMARLHRAGLVEIVPALRQPVLGICLGMQLLGESSGEGGSTGLGWIPSESVRIPSESLRVPHMGWNEVTPVDHHWLFADEPADMRFYFVHSYHLVCKDAHHRIATASYGIELAAAVARDHIVGVQFHPEKSHRFGMQLLRNFASHAFC
jgi:glutamine amidotransferase